MLLLQPLPFKLLQSSHRTKGLWQTLVPPGGSIGGSLLFFIVYVCVLCAGECPYHCQCKWKSGKEIVECQQGGYSSIPTGIHPGTQVLDLSSNSLQVLPEHAFSNVGLIHLQRIYLRWCSLSHVDEEAFFMLTHLTELDLSHNHLMRIPSSFHQLSRLRRLYMNNNLLTHLKQEDFGNMEGLEVLELSHCHLVEVDDGAFQGSDNLRTLKLDGNMLQSLTVASVQAIDGLHLYDNPWNCDCHLKPLRKWMERIDGSFPVGAVPICANPPQFRDTKWNDIAFQNFVCVPRVDIEKPDVFLFEGDNVTVACSVTAGEPNPTIWWIWNGVPLNSSFYENEGNVSSLVLLAANMSDSGLYSCMAENMAGIQSANFTLTVLSGSARTAIGHVAEIAIGIAIAALLLLLIILCIIMIFRRKQRPKAQQKNGVNSKEKDFGFLGPNPIQKPPRLGYYQEVPTIDYIRSPWKMQNREAEPFHKEKGSFPRIELTKEEEMAMMLKTVERFKLDNERNKFRNRQKRAPISLSDSQAIEQELLRDYENPFRRRLLEEGSTCSSSDPLTTPSSPQSHSTPLRSISPSNMSSLSHSTNGRKPMFYEDEGDDGTEV